MLRALEMKDAPYMYEWMNDKEIMCNFSIQKHKRDMVRITEFIKNADVSYKDGGDAHFAIVNDNDEYLGTISLKKINAFSRSAEYAIGMRKCAQHKGYARQATIDILKIAFEEWNLNKVYLNVLSKNYNAIKFYEKMGFKHEGQAREHLFINNKFEDIEWYSILKSEWDIIHY